MTPGAPRGSSQQEGEYFLRSERLGFRCWTAEDLPLALALWGDPEVTRLIVAGGALTEAQVRERLLREITAQAASGVQYWPFFLLQGGELVGCCGLRAYKPEERAYELGFHVRSARWGQGLAAEAARAVMGHAFGVLGATALFAGHHPKNDKSRELLLKLGFRHVRDELYEPTGLMHPSYWLTRREYEAGRGTSA